MKYRILENIFDEFFVEKKKWWGWKRFSYHFKTLEDAENFVRKEKAMNIGVPWVVKEIKLIT